MRQFKYGKLVRDRVLEHLQADGETVQFKVLEGETFIEALRDKLIEEAEELAKETDPEKVVYEIADVLEVIECLGESLGIALEKILRAKKEKVKKSGSFKKAYFVDSVEIENDHPSSAYYSERPDKYPEIKSE